jgi:hypothetical protein
MDQKITVPLGVSIIPAEETINYTPFLMENDIEICYKYYIYIDLKRELIDDVDFFVINLIGSKSINPHY